MDIFAKSFIIIYAHSVADTNKNWPQISKFHNQGLRTKIRLSSWINIFRFKICEKPNNFHTLADDRFGPRLEILIDKKIQRVADIESIFREKLMNPDAIQTFFELSMESRLRLDKYGSIVNFASLYYSYCPPKLNIRIKNYM